MSAKVETTAVVTGASVEFRSVHGALITVRLDVGDEQLSQADLVTRARNAVLQLASLGPADLIQAADEGVCPARPADAGDVFRSWALGR